MTGKCVSSCQTIIPDGSYSIGGVALGVGYDWQFDKVIVGAAADIPWLEVRGNGWCGFPFSAPHACDINSLGTVRARLGYEIGSFGVPLAAYITGGLAFGGIKG